MNLVFISPNFPEYFYNFTQAMRQRGIMVLGIGDGSYDELRNETKDSLAEYYRVNSLENYDEIYRAMGYFIGKYGRIDYIDSQNEYWLETEAKLRVDFNIASGTRIEDLAPMKYKSLMKKVYQEAGIPTARYYLMKSDKGLQDFIKEVGYPIVVKPDNGVGASSTYKIKNPKELQRFIKTKDKDITFIAEEYIDGHVETYDGITNSKLDILISTSHVLLGSIMDTVNEGGDISFYGQFVKGTDIEAIGQKALKAFDARQKFFHLEFFRLHSDKPGLGKKGDLVGLEVNMRAPGAYIPDMMNYSYEQSVYDIYADMLIYDKCFVDPVQKYCIGYVGTRNGLNYKYKTQQIRMKYSNNIISYELVPDALAQAMGNHVYLLKAESEKELKSIFKYVLEKEKPIKVKKTTKK